MPTKAPHKCAGQQCRALTVNRFCARCQAAHDAKRSRWGVTNASTAASRGYDSEWMELRAKVLTRDKRMCCECRRKGMITKATHVDHITPKFKGGTSEMSNLQALCYPCHKLKTSLESMEGKRAKVAYLGTAKGTRHGTSIDENHDEY